MIGMLKKIHNINWKIWNDNKYCIPKWYMEVKATIRGTLIDTCIRTERQKVANLNIDSIKLEKEQKLNPKKEN